MNVGKEQSKLLNISVSGATGTGTITNQWDIARRMRVIPTTENDTYDVAVKDADGDLIMQRTSQTGTLSELQEISLGIAKTVVISNASADGTYKIKFDLH